MPGHRHDLQVGGRVLLADDFHVELPVLAVTSGLGPLVAENRTDRVEFDRAGPDAHAAFDVGAHHAGSKLGPQGKRVTAPVLKGVHLFFHNIGGFADAASKEGGGLEYRYADFPKTVLFDDVTHPGDDVAPVRLIFRQNVLGSGRGFVQQLLFLLFLGYFHRKGLGRAIEDGEN